MSTFGASDEIVSFAGRIEAQVVGVPRYETTIHAHEHHHELLWQVRGTLTVETDRGEMQLMPRTGVWVPHGTMHRLCGQPNDRYGWALIDAAVCPTMWTELRTIHVDPLLHYLLQHSISDLDNDERSNVEDVILDLIRRQLSMPGTEIPMPIDQRCKVIAEELLLNPGCDRSLDAWAYRIGVGSRTLTRLWVAETGTTFSEWRSTVRLRAAIVELAEGRDVGVVARRVGYRTTSAFVAAFRRQTGKTPASYFTELDRSLLSEHDHALLLAPFGR